MPVTFAYGFGSQELLIIGGLVILLFGGAKLPELMKGLGQGMREFKKSVEGIEDQPAAPKTPPTPEKATTAVAAPPAADTTTPSS